MAQQAEATLDPAGQFLSRMRRERITAGVGAPLNIPSFNTAYDLTADDEQTLEDLEEDLSDNYAASRLDAYTPEKARSIETSLRNNFSGTQQASDAAKLAKEIYAAVPGLLGDADTPCEDGGITLGGAATTAFYQLAVTYFDEQGRAIEDSPMGKFMPPRFNTKSIIGWGEIVNAVFVLLWAGVGFLMVMAPFLLVIIIAGGFASLIPGFI